MDPISFGISIHVSEMNPEEQGLKQELRPTAKIFWSVSEMNPEEQGLKRRYSQRMHCTTDSLRDESRRTRIETSKSSSSLCPIGTVSEMNPEEQGLKHQIAERFGYSTFGLRDESRRTRIETIFRSKFRPSAHRSQR